MLIPAINLPVHVYSPAYTCMICIDARARVCVCARILEAEDAWKSGKRVFPGHTIGLRWPPTGPLPPKQPGLSNKSSVSLRYHPLLPPLRKTISSSGLINPTDRIGVRYQLKMMKPNVRPPPRCAYRRPTTASFLSLPILPSPILRDSRLIPSSCLLA